MRFWRQRELAAVNLSVFAFLNENHSYQASLQNEFHFTLEEVKQFFMISHSVALEAYIKAFQYKILNSILYTKAKLYRIGFKLNDSYTFCSSEPETLYHFQYLCSFSVDFWLDFEVFWHQLLKENIRLSLQDILVGMIR